MSHRGYHLPEAVRLRALSLGIQGSQWLNGLDDTISQLEHEWSFRFGQVLNGGSESLVAKVLCRDGRAAILKIGLPGSADLAMEARVYRLAGGRGYAGLIAHDDSHNTLLLEQLGDPLAAFDRPIPEQIEQICNTLQEAWIPLESDEGLMTGAEKAAWLAAFIKEQWQQLDQPCDQRTIDQALAFATERGAAHSPDACVLIHGDAHTFNTLTATTGADGHLGPFKFVDPDGLFAERACDLAVPMREWNRELLEGNTSRLAEQRCELLARLTGVDNHAIWQWGFVERVSTGLVLLQIGMRGEGLEYLAAADELRDVTR